MDRFREVMPACDLNTFEEDNTVAVNKSELSAPVRTICLASIVSLDAEN